VLFRRLIVGSLLSAVERMQAASTAQQRTEARPRGPIFVLGYWRSGTTLLHDYLCLNRHFAYASTYACMNPQHFVFTQASALKRGTPSVRRPMDDVEISAASPQEDEFALLALGARSPYEALVVPSRLAAALQTADPRDLPADDARRWQVTFLEFLGNLSVAEGKRPLILKSPQHGYRVATICELLPDARFVVIVRSPEVVFESVIRMWRSLFSLYGLEPAPPEDEIRRIVLADRPRFEDKLSQGLAGVAPSRVAWLRYEDLVRDPVEQLAKLYTHLGLGDFAGVESRIREQVARHHDYTARNALPPEPWREQVRSRWRGIYERYGYPLS
jgi:omega-hydroxy-beta-dihydromenaquinone-9 sulfotransferase